MLKTIDYCYPFLVLGDDDDGHMIKRYINAHQIIDVEESENMLSILCRDDIEYSYKLENKADAHLVLVSLYRIFNYDHNCNYEIKQFKVH